MDMKQVLNKKYLRDKALALYQAFSAQSVLRKALILSAIIILTGVVFYLLFSSDTETESLVLYEVKKGDFTVRITETGELDALDSVTVSAQADLPVIYLASEGAKVEKGDVLVRFDAAKYEVALEDSKAALQVARADLQKAETEMEAQRQKLLADMSGFEAEVRLAQIALDELKKKPLPDELARAEMEFEKARVANENAMKRMEVLPGLAEKGYITRDTLEKGELDYVEAKTNMKVAQFNLKKVKEGATSQELEQAGIRLERAKFAQEAAKKQAASNLLSFKASVEREKANVERAKKLVDKATVSLARGILAAPRGGLVVYARAEGKEASKVQLGMIPFQGQPLIYLPDLTSMVVNTEVSEFDIGKVKLGTSAEIRPEAYPDTVFHGTVLKIGTLARQKRTASGNTTGIKAFDVAVKIEEADPRLKPGLTATLDIIAHNERDALSVPLSAVVRQKDQTVVHIFKRGRPEARKVILGPGNEERVIIKEGLQEGEKVVLSAH